MRSFIPFFLLLITTTSIRAQIFVNSNHSDSSISNAAFTIDCSGNVNITGMLTEVSDYDLKTDFQPFTHALYKIDKISVYYFKWNDAEARGDQWEMGVIAQEVEVVAPELVTKDENGILSVSYSKMSAMLLAAMKEQQQIIINMQGNLVQVHSFNEELKDEIALSRKREINFEDRLKSLENASGIASKK